MTTESALFWTIIFVFSAWMEHNHEEWGDEAPLGSYPRLFHHLVSLLALAFMGLAALHMIVWTVNRIFS